MVVKNVVFLPLVMVASLLMAGCSTSGNQSIETFQSALWPQSDGVELGIEKINSIPYASAYVKVGENPRIFVVLGYAAGDELSWISQDGVMFVTRHGRLMKTVGLANDLRYMGNLKEDPLVTQRLDRDQSPTWNTVGEWSLQFTSGYAINTRYVRRGKTLIKPLDRPYMTTIIEEQMSISGSESLAGTSWRNYFWIDERTGDVKQSQQQLGPAMPVIKITYLKPYSS